MAASRGTPLQGDRSAHDMTDADLHASDIEDAALIRHLPAPALAGNYVRDDGGNWIVQSGLPLTDLNEYTRGEIIRGGVADWEDYDASTLGAVLIGDGADIISTINPSIAGALTVAGNINTSAGVYQLGGVDINTGGTLANVAYLDQANVFTADQGIDEGRLYIHDTSLDTADPYISIRSNITKSAGVTDDTDDFVGINTYFRFNQAGGIMGYLTGIQNEVRLSDGTIGAGIEDLEGLYHRVVQTGGAAAHDIVGAGASVSLSGGTVANDVFGRFTDIDIDAAYTSIGGDVFAHYIQADVDTDPTGDVYMLYLKEYSGVDYGIFQDGTALNVLGGNLQFVNARSISTTASNLTLEPVADLVLTPGSNQVNTTTGVTMQSDNYTSQTTGWGITYGGAGDFRYLFADELHAKSFIADLEQALAGGQIICKSVAPLAAEFTVPAAAGTSDLYVDEFKGFDDFKVFVDGDLVRLRQFSRAGTSLSITDCWGTVVYVSRDNDTKIQKYTFTRSAGALAGAAAAASTVDQGSLALDYGTTGNGFYEVTAIDGAMAANAPYAQIVTWTTHPLDTLTTQSRWGNLDGIFSQVDEYGLYAGDGILDASHYFRISSDTIELHNLPLKMYDGAANTVFMDPSVPSFAMGTTLPTGIAAPVGGDGIWMGKDTVYKFRVGDVDGERLVWDGSGIYVYTDASTYMVATGTDLEFYANSARTVLLNGTTSALTLGVSTDEHAVIDSNGVSLYDNASMYARFAATTTLGLTASEHISISSTAVQFKDGATVYTDLTAGVLTLGLSTAEHVLIDTSGMTVKDNATTYAVFAATTTLGNIAGGEYISMSSSGIEMYSNAVKIVDIDNSGDFILGEVDDNKSNLFYDESEGRLNFRGGVAGTVVQAYIDTDGSITAGGGNVGLNSEGLRMLAGSAWFIDNGAAITWGSGVTGGTTYAGINAWRDINGVETRGLKLGLDAVGAGADPYIQLVSDTTNPSGVLTILAGRTAIGNGDVYISSELSVNGGSTTPYDLTIWDDGGTDYLGLTHDGTDAYIITNDGNININNSEASGNSAVNIEATGTGTMHLQVEGEMLCKVYDQAAEPTLGADQRFAFWKDSDDSDKIYLIFRRGSGDHVKIQLT